jgi:hypothetical protein
MATSFAHYQDVNGRSDMTPNYAIGCCTSLLHLSLMFSLQMPLFSYAVDKFSSYYQKNAQWLTTPACYNTDAEGKGTKKSGNFPVSNLMKTHLFLFI